MGANGLLRDKMMHVRASDAKASRGLGLADGALAALFNRTKVIGVLSLLKIQNTVFGDGVSKTLLIKLVLIGPVKKKMVILTAVLVG
jgi:hypothetical protein